jgi:hypothetical protein
VSPVKYELGFYIPEDCALHSNRDENLKYYLGCSVCKGTTGRVFIRGASCVPLCQYPAFGVKFPLTGTVRPSDSYRRP